MPKKKKPPAWASQGGKFVARVEQQLSWAGAPCLGYWGLYHVEGPVHTPVNIPGLELDTDMGDDAEVEVAWTFRIVKRGKKPTKKCMNPWPAHHHDVARKRRK